MLPSPGAAVRVTYLSDPPRGAELVIVGGGIVGAATAFHAARAGLRPLIVERRAALCTLTTAAAAGGFRLQQDNEEEFRLVRESVDLFLNFAEATGQSRYDPRILAQGYLWVTTTEEGARRQRRLVDMQRGWGLDDVELLSGAEARRRFPYLDPSVVQARFRAGDGLIDPKAVAFGLAAGSRAPVCLDTTVTGIATAGERLRVDTGRGAIDAEAVVVAAGPFSGVVAAMAGVRLPVEPVARYKVVLPEVPQVPAGAPMTIDDDSGAHWRPAFAGASLLFTDPATPPSPPTEDVPADHRFPLRLLDPDSPTAVARVAPFWREVWEWGAVQWLVQGGQYTMTPDRRPLIGGSGVPGLFVNTGYCGHGVMASPAGSRLLADLLVGKARPEDNPYSVERSFDPLPHLDPL